MPDPDYPATGYILSIIGGILIAADGFLFVLAGLIAVVVWTGAALSSGAIAWVSGMVAVILGLLATYLASQLRTRTTTRTVQRNGIFLIAVGLASFVGGGGFFLGAILAVAGGVLALVWRPSLAGSAPGMTS